MPHRLRRQTAARLRARAWASSPYPRNALRAAQGTDDRGRASQPYCTCSAPESGSPREQGHTRLTKMIGQCRLPRKMALRAFSFHGRVTSLVVAECVMSGTMMAPARGKLQGVSCAVAFAHRSHHARVKQWLRRKLCACEFPRLNWKAVGHTKGTGQPDLCRVVCGTQNWESSRVPS